MTIAVRVLVCLSGLLAVSCGKVRPPPGATATGTPSACSRCHGSSLSAAPPNDLLGGQDPNARGVGAHQAHLAGTRLSAPIACESCHRVPTRASTPGHPEGSWPAKVVFSGLAVAKGAAPLLSAESGTGRLRDDQRLQVSCSNVYCHGATLQGGKQIAPDWNRPGAKWTTCDACHGLPPPPPHPASSSCGGCHAGYSATSVNVATHVNGEVEVGGLGCTSCHGESTRGATALNPQLPASPPVGSKGETLTSERAVGAHQAHLNDGALRKAMACIECHLVPTRAQHSDGAVGITFGALATSGGAAPSWNGTSCTTSYCHGAFPNGAAANSPGWTATQQAVCGSCHGLPPGGTHPAATNCGSCHTGYTAASVDLATHVNGQVEVNGMSCTSCHGDPARSATALNPALAASPPVGSKGETLTSQRAVGAHQAHLSDGALSRAMSCTECHLVPTVPLHSNGSVAVTFGALATTGGATAGWNGTSCTSSYCHGAFPNGAAANAPSWTGSNQAACGSCHGLPPGGTHPARSNCGGCHAGYTATSVDLDTHVNGKVEVAGTGCSSCHGDPARGATTLNPLLPAAPPVGSKGETLTSERAVGAHQAHLNDGALSRAVACTECHLLPTTPQHSDGAVGITFGALATRSGAAPGWSGTSCTSSYCHGAFPNGAAANAPNWTGANQAACGSCHGLPPGGTHPARSNCGGCHAGYTATSVDLDTHVNGKVEVAGTGCSSCHGDPARGATTLNPLLPAAPPVGSKGETLTSERAVGAHQAHLNDGALSRAMACTECHLLPTTPQHSDGAVGITFGALATRSGAAPGWNGASCTTSYCHGAFPNGASGNSPSWTGSDQAACGSCHGLPPGGSHPASSSCGSCHTGYSATSVELSTHVNGQVEVNGLSCTSCHGEPARSATALNPQLPSAPPLGSRGETQTSQRAVGAHQAHLNDGTFSNAISCAECHLVPTSNQHSDGAVGISFGTLATTGGASPGWNGANCTNSYCHGAFPNGAAANAPNWTGSNQAACGSCHGVPPGGTHAANSSCGSCHSGYTAATVNLSTHVNGQVDVSATNLTCTSCHGDAARSATALNPQLPSAPPLGSQGETQTSQRAVGAHQRHLNGGALSSAMPCTECHLVPTSNQHSNGSAGLSFGALATTGGASPGWNGANCTNSYCHGAFPNGAPANAPSWTGSNQAACGSCHGLAPSSGRHALHFGGFGFDCAVCHGAGYSGKSPTLAVDVLRHVNGAFDVAGSGSLITNYVPASKNCASACHEARSW